MSTSNVTSAQPIATSAKPNSMANLQLELWAGDTTELTAPVTKGRVPDLVPITDPFEVVYLERGPILHYMMLQITKSSEKDVIMRALASALTRIFKRPKINFTGSPTAPKELTGLDDLMDDSVPEDAVLNTNFPGAEPVTKKELLEIGGIDEDELGAYFGVLFIAGNKKLTPQNRTAFNERRRNAAMASVIGEAYIFVTDSPYLEDAVIHRIYASFTSLNPIRSAMTQAVIGLLDTAAMGPAQAFAAQFHLLVDIGMGGLVIIRQAMGAYHWTRTEFPELKPAIQAANTAFTLIKTAQPDFRPYLKAIHGNRFVPVNYGQISNLVGVCKRIMTYHSTTLANYAGGTITDVQMARIDRQMGEVSTVAPVTGDLVPE